MYIARTAWTALCAGALALVSACGSSAAGPRAPSATVARGPSATLPSGHSSAPASGACRPGAHTVCLTHSSGGRTVQIGVGWTVGVDLQSPSGVWSGPTQAGAHLLRQLGGVRHDGRGIEVSYRALAPGRTVLRAFERPVCPPMRACPQYILVWQVTIRVAGG
jgi:hypothetical protein